MRHGGIKNNRGRITRMQTTMQTWKFIVDGAQLRQLSRHNNKVYYTTRSNTNVNLISSHWARYNQVFPNYNRYKTPRLVSVAWQLNISKNENTAHLINEPVGTARIRRTLIFFSMNYNWCITIPKSNFISNWTIIIYQWIAHLKRTTRTIIIIHNISFPQ